MSNENKRTSFLAAMNDEEVNELCESGMEDWTAVRDSKLAYELADKLMDDLMFDDESGCWHFREWKRFSQRL